MTFDDLTLGEVEEIQTVALNGANVTDGDPLMLAGGVLWMMARRNGEPDIEWQTFKSRVTMRELKEIQAALNGSPDPLAKPNESES